MKHSLFITTLFFLLVSVPFSLRAQEKEVTLEEVVVTGTRDVQEIRKIPANVTVITREEIERSNSQTAIDLVRSEVGVIVRDWFGNVKKAGVDIRGFGETGLLNTLVLVDGRRVNEIDSSGVDWTQIPIDQVERIEIVRGPGSVLYGDNAVGGVINIITKKPEKPFSGKVEGLGGNYHLNKETGSVSGKWGPLSVALNASYNATEGYRENGFLRAKDVGGKLIYELNQDISLNLSGAFHNDDVGLPGGLTQADMDNLGRRATLNPDNGASTEDGYGAVGVKVKLRNWGRMETELSYRHRNMESFFDYPAYFWTYEDKRISTTWGVTPKYILEKPLLTFHNKLIFGCDFYDSNVELDWKDIFFGVPSFNESKITKRSTGLYLSDEFSILENLILSMGYRHEWVSYDISRQTPMLRDKIRDDKPAWNIGLDYLFGKKSSAFFSVKRSFRFPVSDEFFVIDLNTFELRINSALKPQIGSHYEAGIRHAFTDQIEANLTFFWMDLRNELYLNPETYNNENFPRTRRHGIEIGMKATPFEWLSLWGSYGYIRPILREDPFSGKDIPGVARHKGSIGADIHIWKGLQLNGRALFVDSRYFISDFANQVDKLDGYYSVDAKLSYLWKGLKAFIGVNNLFNRKYSEYAVTNATGTAQSFYPSPERNYFGGISYTF